MHILKFNVVSDSIIINCRESFCCAAKIDWELGTIKVLCVHYIVIDVNNHTGSFDQQETENCVHARLCFCLEFGRGNWNATNNSVVTECA